MVRFGGSEFTNCSVPLVLIDRYFIMEHGEPNPLISVVVERNNELIFEIVKNEPADNPISKVTKTPPGILTVTDSRTNKFLYKLRPDSETSVVFGTISLQEKEIIISDKFIKAGGVTIENCAVVGYGAGVVVNGKGDVAMGAPIPKSLLRLLHLTA